MKWVVCFLKSKIFHYFLMTRLTDCVETFTGVLFHVYVGSVWMLFLDLYQCCVGPLRHTAMFKSSRTITWQFEYCLAVRECCRGFMHRLVSLERYGVTMSKHAFGGFYALMMLSGWFRLVCWSYWGGGAWPYMGCWGGCCCICICPGCCCTTKVPGGGCWATTGPPVTITVVWVYTQTNKTQNGNISAKLRQD